MNKASGGDGIPVELFQILKDDAVKVLHSICQQIWQTQQWPQDWKRSVFIPIAKKGNAKECSNYHTIALTSHNSKVMLKILQARLQQYLNVSFQMFNLNLEKAEEPEIKLPGVSSHFLLQGIFLTQGLNLGLLYYRQILYHLSHEGIPLRLML